MSNEGWNFEHTYANLPKIFYSDQMPTPAIDPQVIVFNKSLAYTLGLNSDKLIDMPEIFTGNVLPHGAKPIAQAYAGYQYGHFAMLGDGRAILLGEHVTQEGQRVDIQLKGAGRTHYSRDGDGLAAIGPMLREFIISEAMFALDIPTSRSLAVTLTGSDVIRQDVFMGAVLTRVAASHIRVGTFGYIATFGDLEDLRKLADYCIWRHFPHIDDTQNAQKNRYLLLLREIARRQASLIAKWQLVGFVHGVMNTDNMAISGETIDYGPCAFLDTYDPKTVFSSIDRNGRYAYKNQPAIGAWNLARLSEALLPLIHHKKTTALELAEKEIVNYWNNYAEYWMDGMRFKLGLTDKEPDDPTLVAQLLDIMEKERLDYTTTFRHIMPLADHGESPLLQIEGFCQWKDKWLARMDLRSISRRDSLYMMQQHNPAVIPRNHHVEVALAEANNGNLSAVNKLLAVLSTPFIDAEEYSLAPEPIACGYKTFCGT